MNHMGIRCSSIMRSKVGRGGKSKPHFRSQGETGGSGEGLNLLTRYLNSCKMRKCHHCYQTAIYSILDISVIAMGKIEKFPI